MGCPYYEMPRYMRGLPDKPKPKPKHEPEVQRRMNIAATDPPKRKRPKGKSP